MEDFAGTAATVSSAATIDNPIVLHVTFFGHHVLNCTSYATDPYMSPQSLHVATEPSGSLRKVLAPGIADPARLGQRLAQ
jgi:hypothetical protein